MLTFGSQVVAFLAVAACGGRSNLLADDTRDETDAAASLGAEGVPPQVACRERATRLEQFGSVDELQQALVGRWMLCNPGQATPLDLGPLGSFWSSDTVGLDFLPNGYAYPLFRSPRGAIIRSGASTQEVSTYQLSLKSLTDFEVAFTEKLFDKQVTLAGLMNQNPTQLQLTDPAGHRYLFAPAR